MMDFEQIRVMVCSSALFTLKVFVRVGRFNFSRVMVLTVKVFFLEGSSIPSREKGLHTGCKTAKCK